MCRHELHSERGVPIISDPKKTFMSEDIHPHQLLSMTLHHYTSLDSSVSIEIELNSTSRSALVTVVVSSRVNRKTDHVTPFSIEVKNACNYTSTPLYVFRVSNFIKHRSNLTLLILHLELGH